jgi:hypothetical protein
MGIFSSFIIQPSRLRRKSCLGIWLSSCLSRSLILADIQALSCRARSSLLHSPKLISLVSTYLTSHYLLSTSSHHVPPLHLALKFLNLNLFNILPGHNHQAKKSTGHIQCNLFFSCHEFRWWREPVLKRLREDYITILWSGVSKIHL